MTEFGAEMGAAAAPPPWVRVIIVNYNGGPYLQQAIDGLGEQTMADFEAVVFDNASTDGSATSLRLPDKRFSLMLSPRNLGFAVANNQAAADARTPWLATLNPDAIPQTGWLAALRSAVDRHPDVAMFGSMQLDGRAPTLLDGAGDCLSIYGFPWRGGSGQPLTTAPDRDYEVFAPCAAAALYRRTAFIEAGGFDASFFCYLEDVDLAFRLRLRAERCIQVRDAVVSHIGSAITGTDSPFTLYHSYRNRIWMIIKNATTPLVLDMLARHLWLCFKDIARQTDPKLRRLLIDALRAAFSELPRVLQDRRRIQRSRVIPASAVRRLLVSDRRAWRHQRIVPLPGSGQQRTSR